jgi:Asp-tRNA(Asn)/Glu-tRNA(Gln) amidotransferase A subunit family amidase
VYVAYKLLATEGALKEGAVTTREWAGPAGGASSDPPPRPPDAAAASPKLARDGGAYTHIRGDEEIRRELGRGAPPGRLAPLRGWTVAVKDLIAIAGRPLNAGSRAREAVPAEQRDAVIVAALRRLGAVVVGTTTLHELAFGVTGVNAYAGTPTNPRAPGCIPGGSSSGSATAVAEGSARIALGTDTGGSVRIPAALCGVVGFKPSYAAYPTDGVLALAPSLDHLGVLAASMGDVCTVHAALGHRLAAPPARPRIGVIRAALEDAQPEVAGVIARLVELAARRGATVVEVAWPEPELVIRSSTTIMFAEAASVHREILERCPELLGDDVRARLDAGAAIGPAALAEAERERAVIRADARRTFEGLDCIVGPTVAVLPPPLAASSDAAVGLRLVANTRLANLVGIPAISLPVGTPGAPVGLQVMAPADDGALAAAAWIEQLAAPD